MSASNAVQEIGICRGCGLYFDLCVCEDPSWDDREDEIEGGGVDSDDPYSEEWES